MAPPAACLFGKLKKGNRKWNVKEIEDYLEKHGSTCVNKQNSWGATPLSIAVRDRKCPLGVFKALVRYGVDVNRKYLGSHPLALCLIYCVSKDVFQVLLDAGCSPADCFSNLCCAVIKEEYLRKDVLHLLIERGADVNEIDFMGRSLMCHALQARVSVSCFEMLCEAGVSLSACTMHSHPLFCATDGSIRPLGRLTKSLVEILLLKSAPLKEIAFSSITPLQLALQWCKCEASALHLLHQHFPEVNCVDKFNNNLLHKTLKNSKFCDPITVKFLIKQGVRVNRKNEYGTTPLHYAVNNRNCPWRVIELLIKNGVAVNDENNQKLTPMDCFVAQDCCDNNFFTLKILLAAGARSKSFLTGKDLTNFRYPSIRPRYFKILLLYTLLEDPNLSIQGMIECHKDYKTLSQYWKKCVIELKRMESVTVSRTCTLREFLITYTIPLNEAAYCKPIVEKYDLNQYLSLKAKNVCNKLLPIIANKMFPLYGDIILDKIRRWFLEAKLCEFRMYTMNWSPRKACQEEKVLLDYESVCKIVEYLVDRDLLSLIVAFTFIDCHVSGKSQEKPIGRKKRSSEGSTKCQKKTKCCT